MHHQIHQQHDGGGNGRVEEKGLSLRLGGKPPPADAPDELVGHAPNQNIDHQRHTILQDGLVVHGAQHRQQQGGGNAAGHIQGQVQKTTVHKPPAFHGGAKDFDAPAEEGVEQQIEKQIENGVGNLHRDTPVCFYWGVFAYILPCNRNLSKKKNWQDGLFSALVILLVFLPDK